MTIQEFIEKAIEGGYRREGVVGLNALDLSEILLPRGAEPILLDVEAWKAVGKVEGWEEKELEIGDEVYFGMPPMFGRITSTDKETARVRTYELSVDGVGLQKLPKEVLHQAVWKQNMHRMIDSLAEGRTIEEYLDTL